MPRQFRAGSFSICIQNLADVLQRDLFSPATLAGELTTVLLLIHSREIRGTSSVQLDEYPDGSSWMDRRVDKQISTGERNEEVRACFDPFIYIYSSSFLRFFSPMRVASLKIGKYLFFISKVCDRIITTGLNRSVNLDIDQIVVLKDYLSITHQD